MPRILIVNPNTTERVTQAVLTEATRCAGPDTSFGTTTAGFGVPIVSTHAENEVAGHAALDLLARHYAGYDAAVLAISFDTAVVAARTILPIPVVGLTEAALHTACLLGRRFGLVVLGRVSLPLYADLLDRIGLRSRMGALRVVDVASADAYLDRDRMDAAVHAAVADLASDGEVDVAVVAGAALAGVAQRIAPSLSIPILDGVAPAVLQATALARLAPHLRRTPPRLAHGTPGLGLGPNLVRLLDGHHPPR